MPIKVTDQSIVRPAFQDPNDKAKGYILLKKGQKQKQKGSFLLIKE